MGSRASDGATALFHWVLKGDSEAVESGKARLAGCSGDASHRALQAAHDSPAGSVLVSVPWRLALSSDSAYQRLQGLEKAGAGLLPGGLSSLTALLSDCAHEELLPPACAWVLLLALHLLCELRDPHSRWAKYVRLLPAPPGSRVAAICSDGPPASDLLLFSAEELGQLQNAALAASVKRERLRLARLHAHLFRQPVGSRPGRLGSPEPSISLESFVWAHCLVRSRALDLTTDQGTFHERCMLPLIDMCNHDSNDTTCSLSVRLSPSGVPRAVDLVAARDISAGEALTLNYGERPMRDLLRGYGFTPAYASVTDPLEVFEDLGDGCQALCIQGSGKGKMFRLVEVRLLSERRADPLLELADAATLCYVVRDDSKCLPDQAQGPVCTTFPANDCRAAAADRRPRPENTGAHGCPEDISGSPSSQQQAAEAKLTVLKDSRECAGRTTGAPDTMGSPSKAYCEHMCSSADHGNSAGSACPDRMIASSAEGCWKSTSIVAVAQGQRAKEQDAADVSYREGVCLRALETDASTSAVDPETERGVLLYLVAECQAVLQQLPTTASQDEALLKSLCSGLTDESAINTGEGDLCGAGDAISSHISGQDCSESGSPGVTARDGRNVKGPQQLSGKGKAAGSSSVSGKQCSSCEGGVRETVCEGKKGWRECRHLEMASQYRLQRKLLLARLAADLAAQAALMC